jgi:hypothetical protein
MKLLRRSWKRLVVALSRRRNEDELAAEIASHIEMQRISERGWRPPKRCARRA